MSTLRRNHKPQLAVEDGVGAFRLYIDLFPEHIVVNQLTFEERQGPSPMTDPDCWDPEPRTATALFPLGSSRLHRKEIE